MGLHSHSNKEVRKRKYTEQYAKTVANKKREEEKRQAKLEKRREKRNKKWNGALPSTTLGDNIPMLNLK